MHPQGGHEAAPPLRDTHRGVRAVIINRTNLVGKTALSSAPPGGRHGDELPLQWRDLPAITREADILVSAVGRKAAVHASPPTW